MVRFSLAAALLALAAAGASGQGTADPNCTDDRLVDRCAEAEQRRMRALYGVRPIEEHAAAGDEVRRVFYVDGYGRDLVLIAFVRTAGRDPEVQVHYPRREGSEQPAALRAPVPQPVWDEIAERALYFDRTFVPRPEAEPSICMHSWVYTIETAEPPNNPREQPLVRRKTEDACGDGPGQVFALELQRIALPLFPHCAALDPEHHRNDTSILDACRILYGDRLAAAEVFNRARAFRQLARPHDAERIAGHFAHDVQIDWAGTPYRGPGYRAGEFWIGRLGAGEYPTNMYVERIDGESSGRVRVTGLLSRTSDTQRGEGTGQETATIEQIWVRDINGTMMIERATIGPWRTSPQ